MKYRIAEFCRLPDKADYTRHIVLRLENPDYIDQGLFKDPSTITPSEQRVVVEGVIMAAKALGCDFVLMNPPPYYREALENRFNEEGMILLYPEMGVAKDGTVYLVRFRTGERLGAKTTTARLTTAYENWLSTHFTKIPEQNLAMCQDPWRMFVDHVVRGIYKRKLH